MDGERVLDALLRTMQPELRPGQYVFVTVQQVLEDVDPVAWIREEEGIGLVLPRQDADRNGLGYDFVAAMITLRVHSSLAAVGLTAAVSGALARAGISCNTVAGTHHDHLFVPADRADESLRVLQELSASTR